MGLRPRHSKKGVTMRSIELGNGESIQYSPMERELFALIPLAPKRISSNDLVHARYGRRNIPHHARGIINSSIRNLRIKIKKNEEPFRLEKSDRAGPHPVFFWVERRA